MAGVYFERIDVQGHHFGPHSTEVHDAVTNLDKTFQTLNQKIKVIWFYLFVFLHSNFLFVIFHIHGTRLNDE